MSHGRLEALIYQASNWAPTATGSSSGAATVSASSARYPSDLLTAFALALSTVTTNTVTVTGSFGESGTGLVTIASNANLAINWGAATDLRDLLGFTGNLSAATSHVATRQCRGVWLPNAEGAFTYGNGDEGHTETDMGVTESPRGDVKGIVFTSRKVLPSALWSHVPAAFARIFQETTIGASFEQWWRWTQGGELAYFYPLSPVRLYWNAAVASYATFRLTSPIGTEMPRTVDEWAGLFRIELTRLVRVPGT